MKTLGILLDYKKIPAGFKKYASAHRRSHRSDRLPSISKVWYTEEHCDKGRVVLDVSTGIHNYQGLRVFMTNVPTTTFMKRKSPNERFSDGGAMRGYIIRRFLNSKHFKDEHLMDRLLQV